MTRFLPIVVLSVTLLGPAATAQELARFGGGLRHENIVCASRDEQGNLIGNGYCSMGNTDERTISGTATIVDENTIEIAGNRLVLSVMTPKRTAELFGEIRRGRTIFCIVGRSEKVGSLEIVPLEAGCLGMMGDAP